MNDIDRMIEKREYEISVMKAYQCGSKIQWKSRETEEWSNIDHPSWAWHMYDYRVKPDD